ncbi:Hypothetical protein ABZS17I87_01813 [Kosakonia cowanii]
MKKEMLSPRWTTRLKDVPAQCRGFFYFSREYVADHNN